MGLICPKCGGKSINYLRNTVDFEYDDEGIVEIVCHCVNAQCNHKFLAYFKVYLPDDQSDILYDEMDNESDPWDKL